MKSGSSILVLVTFILSAGHAWAAAPVVSASANIWLLLLLTTIVLLTTLYWVQKLRREVARRRFAETRLRDERDRFQRYFDMAEAIILTLDLDGHTTMINRKGCELLGYAPEELIGRNWFAICVPAPEGMSRQFTQFVAMLDQPEQENVYQENEILTRSGERRLIAWQISYLRDEQGRVEGTIAAGEDITRRRQMESELKQSVLVLNEIQHAGRIGGWSFDVIHRQMWWTDQLFEIYGVAVDRAPERFREISRQSIECYLKTERTQLVDDFNRAVNEGTPFSREHLLTRFDGKKLWVKSIAHAVYEQGQVVRVVGCLVDISQQKLAQRELEAAIEQAEAASHSKSTFLANMSHELRTPLNVILGYSHILQNDPSISSVQRERVSNIERSGRHLLAQISDILDVSKIEANKIELTPVRLDIRRFAQYICNYFATHAAVKGLELQCLIDEDAARFVMVDERRLQQVLLNLLGNAINYTTKGRVTLSLSRTDDSVAAGKCCLRFSIEDTGIGIEADKLESIFQPFVQLKEKGSKAEGTGLGLNIARQLVRKMGGDIQVESEPGRGSRFWFELELPMIEAVETQALTRFTMPRGYEGKRRRILIVDDMKDNREMLRNMLTRFHLSVVACSCGLDSILLAKEMQPDLIIMDVLMPGMNGYDTLTSLRAINECAAIPVIAISATISEEQSAIQAGFDGFLSKPLSPDLLVSMIGDLLDIKWRYHQSSADSEAAVLLQLPPIDELEKLRQYLELGKLQRIGDWATNVLARNMEYQVFARKLQVHVSQLDETGLALLLDSRESGSNYSH